MLDVVSRLSSRNSKVPRTSESLTAEGSLWEEFEFVQALGNGTYGVVREVRSKTAKSRRRAAKTVPSTEHDEVKMMAPLEHAHICVLHRVIVEKAEMHLLLDLCSGGDLQQWIEARWDDEFTGEKYYDSPGTGQVATITKQMLGALQYIHDRNIAHRDIKPSNWLIASRSLFPVLKLSDFGLAAAFNPDTEPRETFGQLCGSMVYMAPEVFQRSYTERCDIWSTGMVVQDLVCGKPLFVKIPESQLQEVVCGGGVKLDHTEWNYHKPWLKDLVLQMLLTEKAGRPSAATCLDNPDVQSAAALGACCAIA
ncbi:unnamed protein product [Effrenium voratum]|nr:unnamed protein product [Effrenium voratum]